jgi:hypothetical protein
MSERSWQRGMDDACEGCEPRPNQDYDYYEAYRYYDTPMYPAPAYPEYPELESEADAENNS